MKPALQRSPFLTPEILIREPAGPPLIRAYLEGEPRMAAFFTGGHGDPASYLEKAREVDRRFPGSARGRAASLLHPATGPAALRLRRMVEEGGYFVTTGQQPGLFTGPLYSLYKALTAIRLAGALEPLLGRPVLALFWIASEDHDWGEAAHTHLLDVRNDLRTLRLPAPGGALRRPLHRIRLGESIREALDSFLSFLPESDFAPPFRELLREGYPPGRTLPEGFHTVLAGVLRDLPILFVDAANPELKAASLPVLFREMEEARRHERLLAGTVSRLAMAGYDAPVSVLKGGVNLFFEGEEGRERLYQEGKGFRLQRSGVHLQHEELRSRAEDDPTLLSPNVLLRPVVESSLLPTVAYVGGPGEVSYLAQLKELFQAHGLCMPIVHPRNSATLVEAKIRKVLDKSGLTLESLERPHHELASDIARGELPQEVRRALGELRAAIGKGGEALSRAAQEIDTTLRGPITRACNTSFAALDDAERKILQALKRENEITLMQVEKAQRHLFPLGKPQERIINMFYYLIRYGPEIIPAILNEFHVALDDDSA